MGGLKIAISVGGWGNQFWTAVRSGSASLWDAERGRVLLWVPVLIGVGIGIYFSRSDEPQWPAPVAGFVIVIAAAVTWRRIWARYVFMAVALVLLGFLAAMWRTATVATPVVHVKLPPANIEARVDTIDRFADRQHRLLLTVESIDRLAPEQTPVRVRVTVRSAIPDLKAGDRISTRVLLWPPSPPTMPGDFDFGRQLYFERIGALGVVIAPITVRPENADSDSLGDRLAQTIEGWRQSISKRITTALPGVTGAVADALVTGYRAAIPDSVNDDMRKSGLFHILSISGLHMTMVAGIIFFTTRALLAFWETAALRYPIKKWAAVMAGIGTFFYLGISDGSVPAERSFLMTALVLLAIVLDRFPLSLRFVAVAATVVLLLLPDALLNVSFQMSFAAVTALIAVFGDLKHWRRDKERPQFFLWKPMLYVAGLVASTIVAELAIAAAALYHFNDMPLFGVVANVIAVPLSGVVIMPALVLGVVLMPLGLEHWPLQLAGFGIEIMLAIASWVAHTLDVSFRVPAFSNAAFVTLIFGGLWLLLWRTAWRFLGLAAIAVGMWLTTQHDIPDVFIGDEIGVVAVKAPDGQYWMPPGRKGAWERDRLAQREQSDIQRWDWSGKTSPGPWLRCDALGCLYRPNDALTIAIVRDMAAFAEDCSDADIVIADVYPPRSCQPRHAVIGPRDRRRNGAHIVRIQQGDIHITTVGERRNNRPWGR